MKKFKYIRIFSIFEKKVKKNVLKILIFIFLYNFATERTTKKFKLLISQMEDFKNDGSKNFRENVFTKSVRAGKRTYYFDVKETRKGERYITITERKRRYNEDGSFVVEKHKIFLYKEDFDKFADALDDIIDFIETGAEFPTEQENEKSDEYSDVQFDDLDD